MGGSAGLCAERANGASPHASVLQGSECCSGIPEEGFPGARGVFRLMACAFSFNKLYTVLPIADCDKVLLHDPYYRFLIKLGHTTFMALRDALKSLLRARREVPACVELHGRCQRCSHMTPPAQK